MNLNNPINALLHMTFPLTGYFQSISVSGNYLTPYVTVSMVVPKILFVDKSGDPRTVPSSEDIFKNLWDRYRISGISEDQSSNFENYIFYWGEEFPGQTPFQKVLTYFTRNRRIQRFIKDVGETIRVGPTGNSTLTKYVHGEKTGIYTKLDRLGGGAYPSRF